MVHPRVVARYADGRVVKGYAEDFSPHKETFHVHQEREGSGAPVVVERDALKALFFVKTYEGDREHVENLDFEGTRGQGRKMRVRFHDGEILSGFTLGFSKDRPGFFLIPTDPKSNNERIFVVLASVADIEHVT
jgi:hypothetical protein